jgi:hypothetical protein
MNKRAKSVVAQRQEDAERKKRQADAELAEKQKTIYRVYIKDGNQDLSDYGLEANDQDLGGPNADWLILRKDKETIAVFKEWVFFEKLLPTA